MKQKKNLLALILNLCVVVFSIMGLIFDKLTASKLLYFTILSNILIIIICFVFFVFELLQLMGKDLVIPKWLYTLKFVFTVSITLTFLVYTFVLMPYVLKHMGSGMVLTVNNFCLHLISPIFAILSFVLCDENLKIKKFTFVYSVALPFVYFILIMMFSLFPNPPMFDNFVGGFTKFPYFFLSYEEFGWFSLKKGIGVFYWFIFLLIIVLLIGCLYLWIIKKRSSKLLLDN